MNLVKCDPRRMSQEPVKVGYSVYTLFVYKCKRCGREESGHYPEKVLALFGDEEVCVGLCIVCKPCSESAGSGLPVLHLPPACP